MREASAFTIYVLTIGGVLALGIADFVTGRQISFSVLYLFPIAVAEWRLGLARATIVAVLAANTWLAADLADQDYLHAWIPVWNTLARLMMFLIVLRLLTNLRASLGRQTELARKCPLTGLLNARTFEIEAAAGIRMSQERGVPFTFAYLDLDDFKSINDRIGHTGGDDTLRMVTEQLRASVRSTDVLGRLGGDEFAILFPATGSEAAGKVMAGLLDRVRAGVSELPIDVTFSAGATTYLVAPKSLDDVIRASDDLMYEAKREGKNRFVHRVFGVGSPDAVPDITPSREVIPVKTKRSRLEPPIPHAGRVVK